jgi:hypothetical protein
MSISDKTRKILWAKSGNRCAICRRELVIDATTANDDAVVGDECHIVSAKLQGPRFDDHYSSGRIDDSDNLILLCRVHHKMIDDQCATYTVETLKTLRSKHEEWVSERLASAPRMMSIVIQPPEGGPSPQLPRVFSGQALGAIIGNACGYAFTHDDLCSESEVEMLATFFQELQDWGDLWEDLEAGDQVRTRYRLDSMLRELEAEGFLVFGMRDVHTLEGGLTPPSEFPIARLRAVRVCSSGTSAGAS